jgi:UV DNA damage repair endonuclease
MVRLTSDMFSFYTMDGYKEFWQSTDVQSSLQRWFAPIGETARANDVRLSFHPGQFVVLASDKPEVVNKSIEEFEYHADMARWMGYGKQFQDIKINVHISGRAGPAGLRAALKRLTSEARNCITIENEEMSWGLDSTLELAEDLALVLDIHHHWIKTGEYIEANDDRISMVIDSWRGVRPVIHYSVSREDVLVGHSRHQRPDLQPLLESGKNKQKLRAHSDYMWSDAVNDWAKTHWQWADLMCESKAKNLASFALHHSYVKGVIHD